MLEVRGLTVRYGAFTIVDGLSFHVREGEWLMIVGPNGAGKSTVLGAVTQAVPYTGSVLLDGEDVKKMKPAQRARKMGVLMQKNFAGYAFTVEEVVRLGRYAYAPGVLSGHGAEDTEAVEEALKRTGLTAQRGQSVLTLSGGELQRTFLAQVLAQRPRLLLLDEPTNHLDLVYQKQVFELVGEWLRTPGRAVVSVVHDLSLAKAFGTRALLLDHGKTAATGPVGEVLCPEKLDGVYNMDVSAWMRKMLGQWE
ncbi:MAG: ABC transporter ATP-binding protein [Oscillospiraceae bacterium]|nr:ABC transporter ATP-binding protein [Oscillospiraceae bacterium]